MQIEIPFSGRERFGRSKYFQVCAFFWQKSIEAAENGGYFPILAICLGMQWMVDWILGSGVFNINSAAAVNNCAVAG